MYLDIVLQFEDKLIIYKKYIKGNIKKYSRVLFLAATNSLVTNSPAELKHKEILQIVEKVNNVKKNMTARTNSSLRTYIKRAIHNDNKTNTIKKVAHALV